jgi:hypothetical protein
VENSGFPTVFHTCFLPGSVCGKLLRQKFQRGEALLPQARNAAENKFLASTFFSKKGSVTSFLPRFSLFSRFRIHRVYPKTQFSVENSVEKVENAVGKPTSFSQNRWKTQWKKLKNHSRWDTLPIPAPKWSPALPTDFLEWAGQT